MTTADLAVRRLRPEDLPAVVGLLTACDEALLGRRDFTDEEVASDLRREDVEAWGWFDGASLVGYGWLSPVDRSAKVQVDCYVHPEYDAEVGPVVLEHVEQRALALVAASGHREAVLDIGVYRRDDRTRAWMTACGYEAATLFVRMRVDLDGAVTPPALAPGLVVRKSDGSTTDLEVAHRIDETAFTEHYGHVPVSFGAWRQRLVEQGDDWAQLWLAELDGVPVGALIGTRQFEGEDNAGYVRTLGTLPTARGRGVATALLLAYFVDCRRAGRDAVLLHVDVANVTGALALYERVGMRPVLEIDAWTKTRPVTRVD